MNKASQMAGMIAEADRYSRIVEEFPPQDRILSRILERQTNRYRERVLLKCGDVQWTYNETFAIAGQWAQRLSEAGVAGGDRVAIICGNRPEFLQIYLGCAWLGAVAVPINSAFRGAQLAHVLSNSLPKLLVVEAVHRPILKSLPEGTALPSLVWNIEDDRVHDASGQTLNTGAEKSAAPASQVRPGDTVAILYTSGTTGPSKGVCCPQAQLFWWGVYSARALDVREGDVLFTTLPLFHTNALNAFYQALLNGCTYALEPKFSASGFWAAARRHQATVAYLLGAMAVMLLAQPKSADDTAHFLRVALGGGVPGQFHGPFLERFGVPLLDGYGSTETNFVFASRVPSDRPGTMGYLVEGAEACIADADDAPLPD